jgi:ABC-type transport system involved in cytochrome bd biosynthesis fused ATPase/permease subunit
MSHVAYLDSDTAAIPITIVLLVVAAIWIVLSFLVAKFAERKGQNFLGFLLLGLVVSPVIALIAALVIGEKTTSGRDELERLRTLQELRDGGTLTAEEFETEKAKIMARRA